LTLDAHKKPDAGEKSKFFSTVYADEQPDAGKKSKFFSTLEADEKPDAGRNSKFFLTLDNDKKPDAGKKSKFFSTPMRSETRRRPPPLRGRTAPHSLQVHGWEDIQETKTPIRRIYVYV
jgi:hypothetical protein